MRSEVGACDKLGVTQTELVVLRAGAVIATEGRPEFCGYLMAQRLTRRVDGGSLAGNGTIYRILSRLKQEGFLSCRWEESNPETSKRGTTRRLYRLTEEAFQLLTAKAVPRNEHAYK